MFESVLRHRLAPDAAGAGLLALGWFAIVVALAVLLSEVSSGLQEPFTHHDGAYAPYAGERGDGHQDAAEVGHQA